MLTGTRSFAAIGEWVVDQSPQELQALGAGTASPPTGSTIRRAFTSLNANLLDQVIGAHVWNRTHVIQDRRVIAIDGKTVRGARTVNAVAPHLVAVFDHGTATVLGQVAGAAESNEIPAVRDLLATFDLTDVVVTVDAMHTQTDTATAITSAGGDYVFTVEGNQPRSHAKFAILPRTFSGWTVAPLCRGGDLAGQALAVMSSRVHASSVFVPSSLSETNALWSRLVATPLLWRSG